MENQNQNIKDRVIQGDKPSPCVFLCVNDKELLYVYKKIERISFATNLLSSLLLDSEPIKNKLKEDSVKLISLSSGGLGESDNVFLKTILRVLTELHSIFGVLHLSKTLSESNCVIVRNEISDVSAIISKLHSLRSPSHFLSKDNFSVIKEEIPTYIFGQDLLHKGQKDIKDRSFENRNSLSQHKSFDPQKDKNDRQNKILELVKKSSNLTVKDFSKEISGCSEKTIQRELLTMVSKGVLKKEGERRWSRYSVA